MDRKTKGRLAEAKVIAYLIENGYEVYLPFSNNSKYDVIASKDGHLKKLVQNLHQLKNLLVYGQLK